MKDLGVATMNEVLENNQFLQLPRLSNQMVFDALCPVEVSKLRKRLCVTLITGDRQEHEQYRQALRDFVQEYKFSSDRVRFSYVLADRQSDFVSSLVAATPTGDKEGDGDSLAGADPTLRVAILWRQKEDKIRLEWLRTR